MNGSDHEPKHFRTLVHEPEYEQAVERIYRDIRRADSILAGLEAWVSRRAEICYAVVGYPPEEFASWVSKRTREGRVRVIFHYTNEVVTLIDARLIPDNLEGMFY